MSERVAGVGSGVVVRRERVVRRGRVSGVPRRVNGGDGRLEVRGVSSGRVVYESEVWRGEGVKCCPKASSRLNE